MKRRDFLKFSGLSSIGAAGAWFLGKDTRKVVGPFLDDEPFKETVKIAKPPKAKVPTSYVPPKVNNGMLYATCCTWSDLDS